MGKPQLTFYRERDTTDQRRCALEKERPFWSRSPIKRPKWVKHVLCIYFPLKNVLVLTSLKVIKTRTVGEAQVEGGDL